jgi:CheY-like chemotaxis protein
MPQPASPAGIATFKLRFQPVDPLSSRWQQSKVDTMKILVVHRQKEVVAQIAKTLEGKDFAIMHLESGLDGLFTSRIEKFDLVVCGTDLPVVTGFELVRSLRTYSVNRTTPVIFLADTVDNKTERLGVALGAAALLSHSNVNLELPSMISEQVIHWQGSTNN